MHISAIRCKKCGDIIWSRTRHDFRWCTCKSIAIDGGFDYCKISGNAEDIECVTIDLPITREEAYNDWARSIHKLGLIQHEQMIKIVKDKNETIYA